MESLKQIVFEPLNFISGHSNLGGGSNFRVGGPVDVASLKSKSKLGATPVFFSIWSDKSFRSLNPGVSGSSWLFSREKKCWGIIGVVGDKGPGDKGDIGVAIEDLGLAWSQLWNL